MDTSTMPVCPIFANPYTYQWACVCRDVSPTSQIRAEVFFFFFLRLDGNAATRFHEDRVNSVHEAVSSATNDPYSLEFSSGLHRGKPITAAVAVGAPGL